MDLGLAQGMREAIRQAVLILVAAAALGFTYTALTGKGLFAPPPPSRPSEETAPKFISYDEALDLFRGHRAVFVDARHSYDYRLGHIKGAINLPLKDYPENAHLLDRFQKDQLLVTYCDGEECNSSIELAVKLDSAGYGDVRIFFGGWKEWVGKQQPVEQ